MPKKPSAAPIAVASGNPKPPSAISEISINGFKSIWGPEPQRIRIAPLTVLAGANSSGKSSAIQPLLLLKQTLEAGYDPGPLLLHGPHLRLTSTRQIFPMGQGISNLSIGTKFADGSGLAWNYGATSGNHGLRLVEMTFTSTTEKIVLSESLTSKEIERRLPSTLSDILGALATIRRAKLSFRVMRDRCLLNVNVASKNGNSIPALDLFSPVGSLAERIREVIHLAGLRGNPERSYGVSAVGTSMPGSFEPYVAGIILDWQRRQDPRLAGVDRALTHLGLTSRIEATQLDAAAVELKVGRLPKSSNDSRDLVNIADVGFGVSQALPVVVGLLKAEPDQMIYVEQPEIHLHPKAQQAMAGLLVEAAGRGVRVVVETHSSTMLLALQTAIARGKLQPQDAVFHWFARDAEGGTRITSVTPDENGAYGDWPEDFSSSQLEADEKYIGAVEARLFPKP